MALVPAKCTQCGAGLSVDDSQDATICEFCHTPFIVEKAINQYNIDTAHIHADVVSVNLTKDFDIVAGVLSKYSGAATDVIIPDGVIEIAPGTFTGMTGITSVLLPDSVKLIGRKEISTEHGPFRGCTNLKRTVIPDSVEYIMWGAFQYCENLDEVSISDDMLLEFGLSEILHIFLGSPASKILSHQLKQECKERGVCWSCRATLELKKNGKCRNCGVKGHL